MLQEPIHMSNPDRREVIKGLTAGLVLSSPLAADSTTAGTLPTRPLGRTGQNVSMIGLGGSHIGKPTLTDAEAIAIMRAAIDNGLTFMDNSWDYNDGISELRMGKALRDGYRAKVFLMTKIDGRTKQEAAKQIDQSLLRLQTDHVDLLQFHEVIRYEDPDRIFAQGGAIDAFLDAKRAGKLRFIGFTGHKDPHIHLYMLEVAKKHNFHFDTVQMPLNLMDANYRSFAKEVVPVAVSEGIAVLGMKSMGSGVLLKSNTVPAQDYLRYALNLPTSVVITGIDGMPILNQNLEVARTFKPLTQSQLQEMLSKTAPAAANGEYELFKTTSYFDSTAHHPDWLGGSPPRVETLTSPGKA